MTKDQAAKKLMQELQKGTNSGDAHGWIPEAEAELILAEKEDDADRQIFDAAMAAHQNDPITYSIDEVCMLLDLNETN